MNSLTRTLAKFATSQSQQASRRWVTSHSVSTSPKRYTRAKKPAYSNPPAQEPTREWPRPAEIPYQSKVENSVRLSGYIRMPVQSQAASDGKYWAGTVIAQNPSSDPPLWIPIIFEGDLAHVAASHLKEDDHVYIDGQLTADPPSENNGQANVQVIVRTVNFVDESSKNTSIASGKQEGTLSHLAATGKSTVTAEDSWMDLLENPKEWKDYREQKRNGLVKPKHPDFKRKVGGLSLWLDSASKSVLSKLEGLQFDVPFQKSKDFQKSEEVNQLK
ncbi:Primosome PriB/single-strand DNA-binding protein, partial [Corchorus olitorius]